VATFPVEISQRQAGRMGFRSAEHMQRAGDRIFARRVAQQARHEAIRRAFAEDEIIFADMMAQLKQLCGVSLREQELADELQNYCTLMAFELALGHERSYDEVNGDINQIADAHGFLSGVPVPLPGNEQPDLVVADGVPLAEVFRMNQAVREQRETEMAEELRWQVNIRNSWRSLGDQTVCVIDTEQGSMALPRWHAGERMRKLVRAVEVYHNAHMRAEAELRALESLKARITEAQYNVYVLAGIFPERSPRSDVYYYFRKGYPTLAVSFHGAKNNGRVLAALCLHPMGYYQGTHVGLMTPTDEVIAHLLLMRSDEHRFWKKSGQWQASDMRSGL